MGVYATKYALKRIRTDLERIRTDHGSVIRGNPFSIRVYPFKSLLIIPR